jgi:hypothetical protein
MGTLSIVTQTDVYLCFHLSYTSRDIKMHGGGKSSSAKANIRADIWRHVNIS